MGDIYEIDDSIGTDGDGTADLPEENEDTAPLSWTVIEGTAAIKQADRAAFLFRETVLPEHVREFFGVTKLEPGRRKRLVLLLGTRRFDASVEKTVHASPVTRMTWKADFAAVLSQEYPLWHDYFRKNRADAADAPTIQFTKRREVDHYDIELEGAASREAAVVFESPYSPGDTVDNNTLRAAFRCGAQGAIRRSHGTNSLVLVSDHTGPGFDDTWIGKVFHFTGMGLGAEQALSSPLNKTLAGSPDSGVRLFLFEVFESGRYVYIGEMEMSDSPYRSRLTDREKNTRDVYVFPLRIRGGGRPPVARKDLPPAPAEPVLRPAGDVPGRDEGVAAGAPGAFPEVLEPDRIVAEYARRRAAGTCQLCGAPAPFTCPDGEPYLEAHHIVPVRSGGEDAVENVAALCPNCHRKMHLLALPDDVALLKRRAAPGR